MQKIIITIEQIQDNLDFMDVADCLIKELRNTHYSFNFGHIVVNCQEEEISETITRG